MIKSYYQLAKPGIIYGNLITALAGFLFASHWHNSYWALIGMLVGLALSIGCACVINNVIDKGIDSQMERTKKRAIVTGAISPKSALIYAAVLGVSGSVILGVFTNTLTLFVGWFGLVVYILAYGVAKRRTVYSTLIGAFAGAVPPLVGYVAVTGTIDTAGLLIFMILICWQLSHFYAISLYRKSDYAKAKLPVWSVVKGNQSTQIQIIGFIALFTIFSLGLFLFGYTGYSYFLAMLVLGVGWFIYAIRSANQLPAAAWGKKIFLSSLIVIVATSILLAVGPILP